VKLLQGERVDPLSAIWELNLPTLQARVSELRRIGWPIRADEVEHPSLPGEKMVAYWLDAHFRRWWSSNATTHPADYPFTDGRGKFAGWTKADYLKGEKA